jgi:type III restriction enzyme
MSARVQNHINGRLSLRPPQAESLTKLVRALAEAPELLGHEQDVPALLATLKAEFPTLQDFEREFPSLCFALATGVGKTRLMGAFIAYLHLAHGINNFFVLAPNLTIYNKLITDFTPQHAEVRLQGHRRVCTTAAADHHRRQLRPDRRRGAGPDGWLCSRRAHQHLQHLQDQLRGARRQGAAHQADAGGAGRQLLQPPGQPADLVLLMDESHRYRALAGMRAINELKPLFGLEVTATPFVESTRGPVPFKNVVMDYPLARPWQTASSRSPPW